MKRIVTVGLALLLSLSPGGAIPQVPKSGHFSASYGPARQKIHQDVRSGFSQAHSLEAICDFFNTIIKVPRPINLNLSELGSTNAYYLEQQHSISISYEIIAYFFQFFARETPEDVAENTAGAFIFVTFHELGHCLIHELDLPATGREEDAVDEFATLLLIDFGPQGEQAIMAAALWFASNPQSQLPFYDEHSMDQVRFYNVMCLLYGSNPQKYRKFAQTIGIPQRRLDLAEQEFRKKDRAWTFLLKPHIKATPK